MSPWNPKLSNLRNVLAGRYWREEEARRIVIEVGMNPIFIEFSNKSINTWQNIIEQAGHHDKIGDIIAKAREEYPNDPALELAQKDELHLAIEAPAISDAAWHGPKDADVIEKLMGSVSTLRPISFLQRGLDLSRSVVLVQRADMEKGSGFLIKDNLLITNHHVLPSAEVARGATVQFNYQKTAQGNDADIDRYELAPEEGFATSPRPLEGGHDWTAVRVRGNPNSKWGALPLAPAGPKAQDEVIIIQHPGGGPKQIALSHNLVTFVDDQLLQYLTDTLDGSSGSPVFDDQWQVVGLHRDGGWLREPNSKRAVFRNEGTHINVIIDGLKKAQLL